MQLGRSARELIHSVDVVHTHGIWLRLSYRAGQTALRASKPLVMCPHGMLEPWALNYHKWKKRLALALSWRRLLNRASALHATAEQEADQYRRVGLDGPPVAILPNGLYIEPYLAEPNRSMIDQQWSELAGKRLLLFVSRVHPKKGLINLARSWGKLCERFPNWRLVITGPEERGHQAEVERELDRSGASGRYTFTGPVYGQVKAQLMINASLFVLPSFSENFGLVIAESLTAGVPVITTRATPWEELQTRGCGWWIETGEASLTPTLKEAMQLDESKRREMGLRGRELVTNRYAWPTIAKQSLQVYRWLVEGGTQPAIVRTD